MTAPVVDSTADQTAQIPPEWVCAEANTWTPVLPTRRVPDPDCEKVLEHLRDVNPAKDDLVLPLETIAPLASKRAEASGVLTFHTVGCSGDPDTAAPQDAVAQAIAAHLGLPEQPAFLYHLGDIVYKSGDAELDEDAANRQHEGKILQRFYSNEFYAAYRQYRAPILAIPGNHDGKYKYAAAEPETPNCDKSARWHYLANFCARKPGIVFPRNPDGAGDPGRAAQIQPWPYFVLDTPVAYIVGLDANVINGGCLDDPRRFPIGNEGGAVQFRWLVRTLKRLKKERQEKALLLAVHYPPYCGTADFPQRGDAVKCPATLGPKPDRQLAEVLQDAFGQAGEWPDVILSAHAHLYQRLTYRMPGGKHGGAREIPCIIAGSGGHAPVDRMNCTCAKASDPEAAPPIPARMPAGFTFPDGHSATVEAYNDLDFGFVRIHVDAKARRIVGEYFAAYPLTAHAQDGYVRPRHDVFRLDYRKHTLVK
jgi:hypothetical protein